MIYTDWTKKAMKLAYEAHHGQVDKGGMPYVFHPFHLAEQMDDEISTVAALLHDVVEDTDWTLEALAAEGFPAEAIKVLQLLTHPKEAPAQPPRSEDQTGRPAPQQRFHPAQRGDCQPEGTTAAKVHTSLCAIGGEKV